MQLRTHVVARYRCGVSFPAAIPRLLSQRGFTVKTGSWMNAAAQGSAEFGFIVSEDGEAVHLSGGTIEDGRPAFLLATVPTWRFWGFDRRNAFYQRVHEALLSGGAEIWRDYPKNG